MSGGALAPPSVAADLLLLSVGPRSTWTTRGPVHLVVAAGSVADEVLTGGRSAGAGRDEVAADLLRSGRERTDRVVDGLVAAGAVAPLRTRVWGLFPRDGLQVVQPRAQERARARLAEALRPGARPASADAALAALAAVGGLARHHLPVHDAGGREALRAQVTSLAGPAGPGVTEVVMALRSVLGRAGDGDTTGAVFVPASDTDGYGDGGGQGDPGGGADGGDGGGGGGD